MRKTPHNLQYSKRAVICQALAAFSLQPCRALYCQRAAFLLGEYGGGTAEIAG